MRIKQKNSHKVFSLVPGKCKAPDPCQLPFEQMEDMQTEAKTLQMKSSVQFGAWCLPGEMLPMQKYLDIPESGPGGKIIITGCIVAEAFWIVEINQIWWAKGGHCQVKYFKERKKRYNWDTTKKEVWGKKKEEWRKNGNLKGRRVVFWEEIINRNVQAMSPRLLHHGAWS